MVLKTLLAILAYGFSKFFIKVKPVFSNGSISLPKNPVTLPFYTAVFF